MRFSRGNSPISAIVVAVITFGILGLFDKPKKVKKESMNDTSMIIEDLVKITLTLLFIGFVTLTLTPIFPSGKIGFISVLAIAIIGIIIIKYFSNFLYDHFGMVITIISIIIMVKTF